MSKSVNEEYHLDRLEAKVAEIAKQLQVLIDVVASWTVPHIADDRSFSNQNERIIGEPSRIKHTSSENQKQTISNLGKPLSEVFEKLKIQEE